MATATTTSSARKEGKKRATKKKAKSATAAAARREDPTLVEGSDSGLEVSPKQPVEGTAERTHAGRYYVPPTDIYETADALLVVMDMPGVRADGLDVRLEQDVLTVEGRISDGSYLDLEPVYVEYDVGHFARAFTISSDVDADNIRASLADGVLTIELAKAEHAKPRRIPVR